MDQADEQTSLRREVDELRDDLDILARETSRARAAIREPFDPSTEPAVRGARAIPLVVLPAMFIPTAIVLAVLFLGSSGNSSSETLYGRVSAASGQAAGRLGARCTVFLRAVDDEDSSYDTRIDVLCGHDVLYGGESKGYLNCGRSGGLVWRCSDGQYTDEGGDPRLELDRRARRVHVDDRSPTWSLDIELTTPPAGVEVVDGHP